MKKVVFVTPNIDGFVREEPIGTLLLSTILHNNGIASEILSFHRFGNIHNFDDFLANSSSLIFSFDPIVVSFYTRCDTYHISIKIAERLKQVNPDLYIVFAGPQADISARDTMREMSCVDFICCGEGENTVVPFFSSLLNKRPDLSIAGLVYRHAGEIYVNPRPELVSDLDTLPMIDYSLLRFDECTAGNSVKNLFPVDVGRGCPFSCTYCSTKSFWGRKYRLKSAERIIAEINEIYNTFGISQFNFEHDMFTLNRNKIVHICELIKKLPYSITWRCSARLDCLDDELIDIMTSAGMKTLFVGIETGSPEMQKKVKKNLSLEDVAQKIRYITARGVVVTASFIYGFPDETEEEFSQTIALMVDLMDIPNVVVQHHLCAFFAGTELTNTYFDQISTTNTFSNVAGEIAVRECWDIIANHPCLFPHFFEYKSDFREKIKYFPRFMMCWRKNKPIYTYLSKKYGRLHLCDMLFDFTSANLDLLQEGLADNDFVRSDKFIGYFQEDEHIYILNETARYLYWRDNVKSEDTDIFALDAKSIDEGIPIECISSNYTMVRVIKSPNGDLTTKYFRVGS